MASRTPTDLTNNELYDLEDAWNSFMFQCNGVGICWCLTGSFNDLVANFNEKKYLAIKYIHDIDRLVIGAKILTSMKMKRTLEPHYVESYQKLHDGLIRFDKENDLKKKRAIFDELGQLVNNENLRSGGEI